MQTQTRYAPKAGTLASTALITLALPQLEWSALIWIGLVPWFFSLRRCTTLWQAIAQGLWLNVLLGFTATFWVAYVAPRYLDIAMPMGVLVLMAHAMVHQAQLVLFGGLYWWIAGAAPQRNFIALTSLALLYTGIDWAIPKLFQDTLGMVLYSSPWLRQLASFGGAPLLTFVVLFANLGVYAVATDILAARRDGADLLPRVIPSTRRLVLPMAGLLALGAFEDARTTRALESPKQVLRVGVVQGNVDDSLKRRWARGDEDAARQSLQVYVKGTQRLRESQEPPGLIVWPETTFPGVFRKPESDAQLQLNVAFDRFIADLGIPLAFGAYDREDRTDMRVLRNAIYFVTPAPNQAKEQLSPMQVYHKSILFPFGEYFPFLDESVVRRWLPHSAHLSRGDGAKVVRMDPADGEPTRVGPSICYEDLDSDHAVELARSGAEVLINISNDSWFGDFGAPRMHLMMATLRSIETRLPQVRATNSGYSALILPTGEVRDPTQFGTEETRMFEVPIVELGPTLRMRLGDWFGPLSVVIAALGLIWHRRRVS